MIEVDGHWQLCKKIAVGLLSVFSFLLLGNKPLFFCLIIGAQFLTLIHRQLLHQYSVPWHSLFSIDNVCTICVHIIIFHFCIK